MQTKAEGFEHYNKENSTLSQSLGPSGNGVDDAKYESHREATLSLHTHFYHDFVSSCWLLHMIDKMTGDL